MFSKFKQKVSTIFLDINSENFLISQKVNVVVSPSLYWVKKVSLPVKNVRNVKPLLESLFEDILPEGNYSYFAYKKEDYFYIFAYEDKVILDTLKEKGVSATQISNVYFAQSELDNIPDAIKIDESQSIYLRDELVILLPSLWNDGEEVLDIRSVSLSKHKVTLNQFGHIVNKKSFYSVVFVFIIFIALVSIELFMVHQKINTTAKLKDELFSKNNLKTTIIQNRSLLKESTQIHDRQVKIRKYVFHILSLRLNKQQKLSLLDVKENKIIVAFSGITKGKEVNILKSFNTEGMKYIAKIQGSTLHMEISL